MILLQENGRSETWHRDPRMIGLAHLPDGTP